MELQTPMLWDVTCSVCDLDVIRVTTENQVSEILVSWNLCSFLIVWILLHSSYTWLESWNNYSSYTSLQSHLVIHILTLELAALGILVTLLTLFSPSLDESWYRTFLSFPWVLGIQDQVQMFGEQALCPQHHLPDPLLTFMYWTGHWTGHMKASWWVCVLYYMSSRFREKGLAYGYISNYNLSSLHGDFV